MGVVIDDGDKAALCGNVFHSPPVPLEEHHERRFQQYRGKAVPEADFMAGHSDTISFWGVWTTAQVSPQGAALSRTLSAPTVVHTVTPPPSGWPARRREWGRCSHK
ncbi:hypothetical protein GCM10009801_70600 [Streptomyces albiaxialis]|uniref:Uncharacterized protein n=1 Tax=Streptomyces albiaxialis TaxID=329523 RepID=A0ABP5IJI7_9ACTN